MPSILTTALALYFTSLTITSALPQIEMDAANFALTCNSTTADFNLAGKASGATCSSANIVDCCHNIAFVNCRSDGTTNANDETAQIGRNRAFCLSACSCESTGAFGARLGGSDASGGSPVQNPAAPPPGSPVQDPASPPAGSPTGKLGPGGVSCQEWNRMVAANPYLGQEVRPKIVPCP